MHNSHECLDHGDVGLVLKVALMVLTVQQEVLEELLEQVHREGLVVQIGDLAKRLLKILQQRL